MSHREEQRRFWFRGNAVAFGGRITSPVCETLDAQGSVVLPPTGGFASATVGPFNHRNIVAFERATSTVSGHKIDHDGATTGDTLVTVAVEGLNILNMVTADRVVARLTSTHSEKANDEPRMLPFGSYFENLRIGGVPVDLSPRRELLHQGKYSDLTGRRPARPVEVQAEEAVVKEGPDQASIKWRLGPAFDDQYLLAPLFDVAEISDAMPDGCEVNEANGIYIEGFGTIYLGEYLVSRSSRRLTMLRVELGCPVEGTIESVSGENNGHWEP